VTAAGRDLPEHISVYRRVRRVFGEPGLRSIDARRRRRAAEDDSSAPYGLGREPLGLGVVVDALTTSRGWDSPLAQAELLGSWASIVGEETAAHAAPISVEDGVLTVKCDSTAWAQQLRIMRQTILDKVAERFPAAGIESARFLAPDAPSWKHGPKTIPGRGPRDTYG
jgi:predicted nucleic acid-binding Zn ribbon protein